MFIPSALFRQQGLRYLAITSSRYAYRLVPKVCSLTVAVTVKIRNYQQNMGLLKSLVKLSVAGGVVYAAVDQKLLSSQGEAIASFQNIVKRVPVLNQYVEKVSSASLTKEDCAAYWNSGVKVCFAFLAALPTTTKDGFGACIEYTKDFAKSQMKK